MRGTASLVFVVMSRLGSGTAVGGHTSHKGHGFLTQPHPRVGDVSISYGPSASAFLAMEFAPSPAEGIISHLRGLGKPQHSAERPAVKKF
jgi:hypothetical protein